MEKAASHRTLRGLSTRQVLPDATHGLGRNTQVGREHELRHTTRNRRIDPQKLEVSVLCRAAQRTNEALVLGRNVSLQAPAKGGSEALDSVHQMLMGAAIDQQQLGVFNGIDEVPGRSASAQARGVSQPPGLRREDKVMIEVVLDEEGNVESVRTLDAPQSLGDAAMVTMSLHAVKSWRFQPALKDGRPVKYRQQIPVTLR
jgi:TonB family protein